jgi:cytochrome P450 family 4
MISKHADVQRKLNEEIERVLGDKELTFKSLNEFKYLEMVIKETLRMYPPVPIISRRLHEEATVGDYTLPANANYNLSLYGLLQHSEFFENPAEFIPERFLDSIPPFAFIPFSAGQRNCIVRLFFYQLFVYYFDFFFFSFLLSQGQKFAMINMKTTIISILRRFEIKPGDFDLEIQIHITLKCNGIYLKFIPK